MEKIQEALDNYEVKTDPCGGHIEHYGMTEPSSDCEKSEPEVLDWVFFDEDAPDEDSDIEYISFRYKEYFGKKSGSLHNTEI